MAVKKYITNMAKNEIFETSCILFWERLQKKGGGGRRKVSNSCTIFEYTMQKTNFSSSILLSKPEHTALIPRRGVERP